MKLPIAAMLFAIGLASSALAQTPSALVEEVRGKVDGIEFMDYVVPGKVIALGPKSSVVLGYLRSCWRETITGGTVVVGTDESKVVMGDVQRVKVPCDASAVQISDRESSQSAATAFRTVRGEVPPASPLPVLYATSPLLQVKSATGTLVIERTDKTEERRTVALKKDMLQRGRFIDLAKAKVALAPGGSYAAVLGDRRVPFRIDSSATAASSPMVGRLLRIE